MFMQTVYKIIPENIITDAANVATEMGDEQNSFVRLLSAAKEFKAAGMTPIFLLDGDKMDMFCVAKETFKKKLH